MRPTDRGREGGGAGRGGGDDGGDGDDAYELMFKRSDA